MNKIIEFENLTNYSKMNSFYLEWLSFVKDKLDPDKFDNTDLPISNTMSNYELILKSILINLSMRLTALEEDQLLFEKEHQDDDIRKKYNKLKDMYLNPSKAKEYNELIKDYLPDTIEKEIEENKDDEEYIDELYEELAYIDSDNNYYYRSKEEYNVIIPKIFEKINIRSDKVEKETDKDKFYQVRNCLAHHEYKIGLSSFNIDQEGIEVGLSNIKIILDNGKIYGEITLEELLELVNIYECFSLLFSNKDFEILCNYRISGEGSNKRKISYKFSEYKTPNDEDPLDVESAMLYAINTDEESMFIDDLGDYYNIDTLAKLLQQAGYTFCEAKEEQLTYEERQLFNKIIEYRNKIVPDRLKTTGTILRETGEVINKYFESINRNKVAFNSTDIIDFFVKFFGKTIYYFAKDRIVSMKPLEYYNSPYYVKFNPLLNGNKNNLIGLSTLTTTPIIYSNFLLEYLFFNINYVKELNAKEAEKGQTIFKYHNLNLDNIDVYNYDTNGNLLNTTPYEIRNKKGVMLEEKFKLEQEVKELIELIINIINLNNEDSKYPNKVIKLKEVNDKLQVLKDKYNLLEVIDIISNNLENNSNHNKSIIKNTLLKLLNNPYKIEDLSEEEKDIKKLFTKKEREKYNKKTYDLSMFNNQLLEINNYLSKDDTETEYKDCSNFLSHLRNAITHGNYIVNYSNAFTSDNSIDYDNISYDFYDIDPNTNKKVFEIRNITSRRLLELLNDYSKLVENTDRPDFIKDISKDNEIIDKAEEFMPNTKNEIKVRL